MLSSKLKLRREQYSYPTIVLRRGTAHKFRTTAELDYYHSGLLNSKLRIHKVAGVLSVIFWGHVSGKNGRPNPSFALAKVNRAIGSAKFCSTRVANSVSEASRLINRKRYGQAVLKLTAVPQLGFAFASKVCAFISGDECGVIDSIIVEKYPQFGFHTRGRYVTKHKRNAVAYDKYCRYLQNAAKGLNRIGKKSFWRDLDGNAYPWRAVDVERALYK